MTLSVELLVNEDTRYFIELKYIEYSPYLLVALNTERLLSGRKFLCLEVENKDLVANYISFLKGDDFTMTEEDAFFFNYMGHINSLEYPIDYWRVKLKSKWVRDNFYKLNLATRDNGMYGLVEVPILRNYNSKLILYATGRYGELSTINVDTNEHGVVVAGGAALYMAGYSHVCSDIDFFSIDKMKSIRFIRTGIEKDEYKESKTRQHHSIRRHVDVKVTSNSYKRDGNMYGQHNISLIRRVYTCPSEVVHGFDLDASQFVLIYKEGIPTLYATEIGLWSASNAEQWYDPEMVSTTYVERLHKYSTRGITMRLPLISRKNVSTYILKNDVKFIIPNVIENIYCWNNNMREEYFRELCKENNLPIDMGSILIYASLFRGINPNAIKRMTQTYLNDSRSYCKESLYIEGSIWDLPWIEVNPMEQTVLSGVIYPLDKEDIMETYRKSPLYLG